jgi:hypothetical protein
MCVFVRPAQPKETLIFKRDWERPTALSTLIIIIHNTCIPIIQLKYCVVTLIQVKNPTFDRVKTWHREEKQLPAWAKSWTSAVNSHVRNWTRDARKSRYNFCSNYVETCKHVGNIERSDESRSREYATWSTAIKNQFSAARGRCLRAF